MYVLYVLDVDFVGGSLDGSDALLQAKSGQTARSRVSRVSRVGHVEPDTYSMSYSMYLPRVPLIVLLRST